jgi:hypothetical protein
MLSKAAEILIGLAVVGLMVNDIFQTAIVPRAVGRRWRASAYWTRATWRLCLAYTRRLSDPEARERVLGVYAPSALILTFVLWLTLLIVGYGLIFHGLRSGIKPSPSLWDAIYFAGTSVLTIGYGDVVATAGGARFFAILAGATGFASVAIVTSFLFALFRAFQEREVFVVTFGTRAGAPPSGVELLVTHARLGLMSDLSGVFREGQRWTAQVLESHLAYPMLPYFRSSHDYESWVAALGALLDAATLLITTLREEAAGEARLMHAIGLHAVHDLTNYFRLRSAEGVGIERSEYEAAGERLRAAGLHPDRTDAAWEAFSALRAAYAGRLNALARFFDIPPAQWVGDRSLIVIEHHGLPAQVVEPVLR